MVGRERVFISEADQYLFAQGTHYEIYKKLGAHLSVDKNGNEGTFFAVWAPNARAVHVVGNFSDWEEGYPMTKIGPGGIWTAFVPENLLGELYKYMIETAQGEILYKADPYANSAELRPGTASMVADMSGFTWTDSKWMESRREKDLQKEPMAIYECHIGSWMRHPGEEKNGFYNYREFADKIAEYLKNMKFTHVELMGIAEYPYDGSWGYQVTGYYAPTSRYGTPQDFMYLVNTLHKHGIGVILDWVPAHFATDAHGLGCFDGGCIYEHPDPRLGEHPDWGTKIFNLNKNEVKNFLIANTFFWMKEFHVDGIRVDAVASMLYLDYGKQDGQWIPNKYGENKNLDAIEFFRHLNSILSKEENGFITIAEESTAWPMVSGPVEDGGLGFSFKWNMGWMHDFCQYMKLDPYFRRDNHYAMTFAMSYHESENYILPLSHDEVVHLKCSMVNKMPGLQKDKYANLRVGYAYMFGHSGKKLLFMGQEFGQEREWSEERELDWFLLKEEQNQGMLQYTGELLKIYRKYPCMHSLDNTWAGFEWMNANDKERSIYSFLRKDETGKRNILVILNMTPVERKEYMLGVPKKGKYKLILNSDETRFGGAGNEIPEEIQAKLKECDGKEYSISFDLPPLTAAMFLFS